MARTFSFEDIHVDNDNGTVRTRLDVDMSRFEQQYTKAQFELDSEVMTGMIPFMPMITSSFINVTKAMSASIAGTGYVYAAAPPYGRFLYYGKTMVSPTTGSPFAEAGEKKVLVSQYQGKTNAKEFLQYTKQAHPQVEREWFEAAKRIYGKKWAAHAKKVAGGGNG